MAVVEDAPRLHRSWLVRLRQSARPAEVSGDVEACLAGLEDLGRDAFNVYPAYYEEPAPDVAALVGRLRKLGATSGVARDAEAAPAHVQFWRG